ncbi:hypothetical protein AV530_019570 [Patagioenas fasciata monilis]|uniref:Uncharacterized protein n=1 Tax=Patagioenas fasciata monilis TaxID=372326 RepID=A0A1V4JE29_PATFA|nr:hypothetical protein AV530_019570 [Patagioenas fasciata monilis]
MWPLDKAMTISQLSRTLLWLCRVYLQPECPASFQAANVTSTEKFKSVNRVTEPACASCGYRNVLVFWEKKQYKGWKLNFSSWSLLFSHTLQCRLKILTTQLRRLLLKSNCSISDQLLKPSICHFKHCWFNCCHNYLAV